MTRAHASRAIALLERTGRQAVRQAGRQRSQQRGRLERQKTRGSARGVKRPRRGLVLRRHGGSYLGVSLARRARLEPRRQRRKPSPRDANAKPHAYTWSQRVSEIYRMWDAGE